MTSLTVAVASRRLSLRASVRTEHVSSNSIICVSATPDEAGFFESLRRSLLTPSGIVGVIVGCCFYFLLARSGGDITDALFAALIGFVCGYGGVGFVDSCLRLVESRRRPPV
jgi:hypothetical protein